MLLALTLPLVLSLPGAAPRPVLNNGVFPDKIVLGQSCALKGPAAGLGTGMNAGLKACFDAVNAKGGVQGRKIELNVENDSYEPSHAKPRHASWSRMSTSS